MSAPATPQTATTTWNIDPVHSVAEFKVKHMMISNVKGQFTGAQGRPDSGRNRLDEIPCRRHRSTRPPSTRAIRSAMRISRAPTSSMWRSFPTLSFKSTRITRAGDGELAVAGDLTIHGVTRNVVFTVEGPTPPAKDPWGNTRMGAFGDHQDQPQGLRLDLERRARNRRHSGRRRSDHHARRRSS